MRAWRASARNPSDSKIEHPGLNSKQFRVVFSGISCALLSAGAGIFVYLFVVLFRGHPFRNAEKK